MATLPFSDLSQRSLTDDDQQNEERFFTLPQFPTEEERPLANRAHKHRAALPEESYEPSLTAEHSPCPSSSSVYCCPKQGPVGPQGAQGPIGPCGPRGHRGERGPCGDCGPTGPCGPCGDCGQCGPTGPRGPKGEMGCQGPIGPCGPRGEKGHHGDCGPCGPRGHCGPTGPQGIPGQQGPQGWRGECGQVGCTGPQGMMGPTGPQGERGPPGTCECCPGSNSASYVFIAKDSNVSAGKVFVIKSHHPINVTLPRLEKKEIRYDEEMQGQEVTVKNMTGVTHFLKAQKDNSFNGNHTTYSLGPWKKVTLNGVGPWWLD